MTHPTLQEIQATQGTRKDETPPWMSYAAEMEQKLDPRLEREIAEYAERRHDVKVSNHAKEILHEQQEMSDELSGQYQWVKRKEYEHVAPRIGRVMHPHQLITLLRSAGLKCWYREHPHPDKVVLVIQRKEWLDPEVGCWVQYGLMPEYSIMRFDEHDIPLDERRRGWRTCLLQLLLKEALTEEKAIEVFGEAQGPASTRYLSTLYGFRNRESRWLEAQ